MDYTSKEKAFWEAHNTIKMEGASARKNEDALKLRKPVINNGRCASKGFELPGAVEPPSAKRFVIGCPYFSIKRDSVKLVDITT